MAVVAEEEEADVAVVWQFDNLKEIGGQELTVVGEPRVVDTPGRKALSAFDEVDDAIFLDVHPLAGAKQFTVEVARPDARRSPEQQFFHLEEDGNENRICSRHGCDEYPRHVHPEVARPGRRCSPRTGTRSTSGIAAIVVDGKEMRAYVDGKLEMSTPLAFEPHKEGRTSLGVRINKVFWFKGAATRDSAARGSKGLQRKRSRVMSG